MTLTTIAKIILNMAWAPRLDAAWERALRRAEQAPNSALIRSACCRFVTWPSAYGRRRPQRRDKSDV